MCTVGMFARALIQVTQPTRCHCIQALTLEFLPQDHTNLPLLPLVQGKGRPCECHSTHQRPYFTHVVGLKKLWHLFKHLVVFLQEKISWNSHCGCPTVQIRPKSHLHSSFYEQRSFWERGQQSELSFPLIRSKWEGVKKWRDNQKTLIDSENTISILTWLVVYTFTKQQDHCINIILQTSFINIHIICWKNNLPPRHKSFWATILRSMYLSETFLSA